MLDRRISTLKGKNRKSERRDRTQTIEEKKRRTPQSISEAYQKEKGGEEGENTFGVYQRVPR